MLVIDPMHNLYLGTAKRIFNNETINEASLKVIKERVASLVIPPEVRFSRLPESIMCYPSSLTAEQWLLWVNYYCMYCLFDVLPSRDFECWKNLY